MKKIILRSRQDGGTWLQNITPEHFSLYEEAVREFGDLMLVIYPRPDPRGRADWKSLHYVGDDMRKLNAFWELVRAIQAEMQHPEPAGDCIEELR